jgi:hypothetical protein
LEEKPTPMQRALLEELRLVDPSLGLGATKRETTEVLRRAIAGQRRAKWGARRNAAA